MLHYSGHRPTLDLVQKFLGYFADIRAALDGQGMWDEADRLFYDRIVTPDGGHVPVKVHSMVGIIPMLAVTRSPRFTATIPTSSRWKGAAPA